MVIVAGDIGNPQKPGSSCRILSNLKKLGKPIFYVKGNWDIGCEKCGVGVELENINPYKVGSIYILGHGKKITPVSPRPELPTVLVTHYPPYSIMDRGKKLETSQQSAHSGLPEINYLVEYYKPIVHIFGHSHSFGGVDITFNGILYVNVARLDRTMRDGTPIGNYAIIEVREDAPPKVNWYFLNGVWKRCSSCGRTVHLPKAWTICRRCANRNDLKFSAVNSQYSRVKLNISEDPRGRATTFSEELSIPVSTIKDKLALEDFLDILMLKHFVKFLKNRHQKVLVLPKGKVIEFYTAMGDEEIVPFSEYLFSCEDSKMGSRLCVLMRLYSLNKRVYVIWGFDQAEGLGYGKVGGGKLVLSKEYVLFDRRLAMKNENVVPELISRGFTPLLYSRTFRGEQGGIREALENLRRMLRKRRQ